MDGRTGCTPYLAQTLNKSSREITEARESVLPGLCHWTPARTVSHGEEAI